MRIGVVGDTHNNMKNVDQIVDLLNGARVERVVHTGDITQAKVLAAMSALAAPLHVVYGNNDEERTSLAAAARHHAIELVDPPLHLEWAGRRILVVHDPKDVEPAMDADHDLVLHGHTHLYRRERVGEALVFSPGECAGMLPGLNAVGVVDLVELRCDLLRF